MIKPSSDIDQSIRFLQWLRPEGPWVLTAIPPEGGRTETETFTDTGKARAWLEKLSGRQNLYFMVNPTRGKVDKKAKKEDVEELAFLHVDVDPRKGEDLKSEQARAIKVLEGFSPSPSAIIFSGGGYQAFWRLEEPVYIGGDANRIAESEAYNRQMEIVLGGDHCWNIDRIMRIPGTINIPDEKKRKRGRTETLATIVELSEPTVMIEPKGVDAFPAPNRLKVIIASNEDWVVSASADERRFAVFDVSPHFAAPPGSAQSDERGRWWAALNAEIDGGGLEAFLHDLLAEDLSGWHPRYDVPQNDALVGQKAASLRGLERVLYDILSAGTVPVNLRVAQLSEDSFVVPTEELQKYCAGLARRFDPTSNAIGYLLGEGRRVRGGTVPRPGLGFTKRDYPRPKGWVWPPLVEARRRWDEAFWPGEWDTSSRWSLDEEEEGGGRGWYDAPY